VRNWDSPDVPSLTYLGLPLPPSSPHISNMSRLHTPTLSNLAEEDGESLYPVVPTIRQQSYPLTTLPTFTAAPTVKRHTLKSTFTSPAAILTTNSTASGSGVRDGPASRSDIYSQFMRRYRRGFSTDDGARLGEPEDHAAASGLLSHWDMGESDDDEPESMNWLSDSSRTHASGSNSPHYDEDVEPKTSDERERLEWQAMLTSVMGGDVLKTEKTRIAKALDPLAIDRHNDRYKDLWLELRANLAGISIKEETRSLEELRLRYVDSVIHDILEFRVRTEPEPGNPEPISPTYQVTLILRRLDAIEDLYPTLRSLYNDKSICLEEDFRNRRDALVSWANIASSIKQQVSSFQKWTGSASLDVSEKQGEPPLSSANGSITGQQSDSSTFVERVLKEESLQRMFEKKTLTTLHHFLIRTKSSLAVYASIFQKLNLPGFEEELAQLVSFPLRLVEAILKLRIEYAKGVREFDLLVAEQMIEDFRIAIGLACTLRAEYEFHFMPDEAHGWNVPPCISGEYDSIILQAVKRLFYFIHQRMRLIPLEDADIMVHSALFDEISLILVDGSAVVAEQLWYANSFLSSVI
jgi:mitogen-activated protein kinase kinase kinase